MKNEKLFHQILDLIWHLISEHCKMVLDYQFHGKALATFRWRWILTSESKSSEEEDAGFWLVKQHVNCTDFAPTDCKIGKRLSHMQDPSMWCGPLFFFLSSLTRPYACLPVEPSQEHGCSGSYNLGAAPSSLLSPLFLCQQWQTTKHPTATQLRQIHSILATIPHTKEKEPNT